MSYNNLLNKDGITKGHLIHVLLNKNYVCKKLFYYCYHHGIVLQFIIPRSKDKEYTELFSLLMRPDNTPLSLMTVVYLEYTDLYTVTD